MPLQAVPLLAFFFKRRGQCVLPPPIAGQSGSRAAPEWLRAFAEGPQLSVLGQVGLVQGEGLPVRDW
jgi:hypothetical protein